MPAYDAAALAALADEQVSRRDRVLPPAFWGRTIAEVLADRPRLATLIAHAFLFVARKGDALPGVVKGRGR